MSATMTPQVCCQISTEGLVAGVAGSRACGDKAHLVLVPELEPEVLPCLAECEIINVHKQELHLTIPT